MTNLTPLVRPAGIDTLVITPEQAAAIENRAQARDENRAIPTEPTEYFDHQRVERIRGELRSSLIVDPLDGKLPVTEEFTKTFAALRATRAASEGPETRTAFERCLPTLTAQPPMLPFQSNALWRVVQTKDIVMIQAEAINDARVIRMNAKHAPATIASWLGDSIGWWEDDTLVVESKYFHSRYPGRFSPDHSFLISDQATVTEWFSRIADDEILYQFKVDDLVYYTAPWRGETHFLRTNDQVFEYACHEGNYSLPSILRAVRIKETEESSR